MGSSTALAQAPPDTMQLARRRAVALRVADAPVIDGGLDERVWQDATPISDFIQSEPVEGRPQSGQRFACCTTRPPSTWASPVTTATHPESS